MYMLLQNLYSTRYNAKALKCKRMAKKFRQAILPTVRSYYFLWPEKHAARVLKRIAPWGLAMFSGDVVESMIAHFQGHFPHGNGSRGGWWYKYRTGCTAVDASNAQGVPA